MFPSATADFYTVVYCCTLIGGGLGDCLTQTSPRSDAYHNHEELFVSRVEVNPGSSDLEFPRKLMATSRETMRRPLLLPSASVVLLFLEAETLYRMTTGLEMMITRVLPNFHAHVYNL